MLFSFLYSIYILRENVMQTTPTEKEILCLKAAYISPRTPRIFSHTLTYWGELILQAGSSSLLLPASAESSGFKNDPDIHMHNRWAVWMLSAHEYKAGPAASGVELTGNPSVFTDLLAISSSPNYFSSLGKTLSITVRLSKDKNSLLAD